MLTTTCKEQAPSLRESRCGQEAPSWGKESASFAMTLRTERNEAKLHSLGQRQGTTLAPSGKEGLPVRHPHFSLVSDPVFVGEAKEAGYRAVNIIRLMKHNCCVALTPVPQEGSRLISVPHASSLPPRKVSIHCVPENDHRPLQNACRLPLP